MESSPRKTMSSRKNPCSQTGASSRQGRTQGAFRKRHVWRITWPPLPCLMRGLGAAGGGIGVAGSAAGLARPLKLDVFCRRKPASLQAGVLDGE